MSELRWRRQRKSCGQSYTDEIASDDERDKRVSDDRDQCLVDSADAFYLEAVGCAQEDDKEDTDEEVGVMTWWM